jgi:hypothetical protein
MNNGAPEDNGHAKLARKDVPFGAESINVATPMMKATPVMSTMTISWLILVFLI